MDAKEIYGELTKIFRSVFRDETLVADPAMTAKDVAGWDSLRNIRLMLTIEKTYKVRFSAAEIGTLKNVGDLVRLIQAKI